MNNRAVQQKVASNWKQFSLSVAFVLTLLIAAAVAPAAMRQRFVQAWKSLDAAKWDNLYVSAKQPRREYRHPSKIAEAIHLPELLSYAEAQGLEQNFHRISSVEIASWEDPDTLATAGKLMGQCANLRHLYWYAPAPSQVRFDLCRNLTFMHLKDCDAGPFVDGLLQADSKIEAIVCYRCQIRDEHLRSLSALQELKLLTLVDCNANSATVQDLRDEMKKCYLVVL